MKKILLILAIVSLVLFSGCVQPSDGKDAIGPCENVSCATNEKCVDGNCKLKTCSEQRGTICSEGQTCHADVIPASDTAKCCIEICKVEEDSKVKCKIGERCSDLKDDTNLQAETPSITLTNKITFNTWSNYTGKSIFHYYVTIPNKGQKATVEIKNTDNIEIKFLKYANMDEKREKLKELENFNSDLWKEIGILSDGSYSFEVTAEGVYILFQVSTKNITGEYEIPMRIIYEDRYTDEVIYVEISDKMLLKPEEIPQNLRVFVHGLNYEQSWTCTGYSSKYGYFHQANPTVQKYLKEWTKDITDVEEASRQLYEKVHDALNGARGKYTSKCFPGVVMQDYIYLTELEEEGQTYGFCQEKATLYISFIRGLGIPARLIYLTTMNETGHATAEIWLPNKGWTYVDPEWLYFDSTNVDYPFPIDYGCSTSGCSYFNPYFTGDPMVLTEFYVSLMPFSEVYNKWNDRFDYTFIIYNK